MNAETTNLNNASLIYYPNFLSPPLATKIYDQLLSLSSWKQEPIKIFGKEIMQPRLTLLFGETDMKYGYSGIKMETEPFPDFLRELKNDCESVTNTSFNVCLANLYRDGSDSMGWHSDDEKELGDKPVIASISLGEERMFHLKHKTNPEEKYKKRLQHGSLLIMQGSTQKFWKHQLPKTKKGIGPRINLTFRKIY
ncbi:alpha-ketoglutarate-dependent dioxygenase AlkB family protein [Christiangramia aquimixticola]|uniref:alpha-ketoglutarate-dependent dioxygenase AlkB family protein n=1 Tax=Christiangramia aquimixticola TaxID=1697558 RepID=UPI003AA91B63